MTFYSWSTDSQGDIELWKFPKENPDNKQLLAQFPGEQDGQIFIIPGWDQIFVRSWKRQPDGSVTTNAVYLVAADGSDLHKLELPEA